MKHKFSILIIEVRVGTARNKKVFGELKNISCTCDFKSKVTHKNSLFKQV